MAGLIDGLGPVPLLPRQPVKMGSSRRRLARLLAATAWLTQGGDGPNTSFRRLVPPLLLDLAPDLRDAAGLAIEWMVNVKTTPDKIGNAIAAARRKVEWTHGKMAACRPLSLFLYTQCN